MIVGAGEKLEKPLPKATEEWLAKQGIAVEQMDTVSTLGIHLICPLGSTRCQPNPTAT